MYVSVQDSLQLASKLTLKRITNALQVYSSFQHSRKSGSATIKGLPISLSIEPTTACNLRCPECPSGLRSFTRPTGKLDPALFRKLMDELGGSLLYLIFYFQGEPYLHPEFLSMVRYASQKNIYTATSTNGHFLDEATAHQTVNSGLDRLIISIDGADQQTYESYRKSGNLSSVLQGTHNMVRAKKALRSATPAIVWQFLVVRPNEHQLGEIRKMAREYGVDRVAFKTAQLYDYENGNDLMPTLDDYSRYARGSDGKYQIKHSLQDECWKMWHSCVVTWDGRVVPCCFDKDAQHVMGDVSGMDFEKIWRSEAYDRFRLSLLTARSSIEMCKNCTEGGRVWV